MLGHGLQGAPLCASFFSPELALASLADAADYLLLSVLPMLAVVAHAVCGAAAFASLESPQLFLH